MTRAQDIRTRVLEDIVSGKRAPGTPLDEGELASAYGVSRTPVREALRQLEIEGYAQSRPRRGAVVATFTQTQLAEMFQVMAELEAFCGLLAARAMSASEGAELEKVRQACERAVASDSIDEYLTCNDQFHELIYRASHNDYLAELTRSVRMRVAPYRRAQFRSAGRLAKSLAEHEQITQALRARDGERAARELRNHIFTVEHAFYVHQAGDS